MRDVQRIGIFDIRLFNTDRHAGNMLVRRPPPRASASSSVAAPQRLDGAALLELAAWELVPIDHGFALPEALEPPYFEWQHWPQAMLPFGREELDYIAALDAKADIRMLRQEVGAVAGLWQAWGLGWGCWVGACRAACLAPAESAPPISIATPCLHLPTHSFLLSTAHPTLQVPSLRVESLRVLEVCTTLLQACAAAGLTLAEIAGVVTRPLIGMEEEPSELERICFNARAEVEELSDDDDECCGIDVIAEAAEEGESEGGRFRWCWLGAVYWGA